ncbi:MAG: SRPBCC family protein [Anaerolineae bacterium]|nr:SRPBCC family protein [Anaerolineae bacterium]
MEIRAAHQVNAPVDVTFQVFPMLPSSPTALKRSKAVEIVSAVQQGEGMRWRETRLMFGKEATEEMEIRAFLPNQSYDVVAESRGMRYHTRYTFAPQGGGTRVEMVFSGTPTSLPARLMSMLSFFFAGAMRKALHGDLQTLGAVAEQSSPAH